MNQRIVDVQEDKQVQQCVSILAQPKAGRYLLRQYLRSVSSGFNRGTSRCAVSAKQQDNRLGAAVPAIPLVPPGALQAGLPPADAAQA
jgi:hypothetical protein